MGSSRECDSFLFVEETEMKWKKKKTHFFFFSKKKGRKKRLVSLKTLSCRFRACARPRSLAPLPALDRRERCRITPREAAAAAAAARAPPTSLPVSFSFFSLERKKEKKNACGSKKKKRKKNGNTFHGGRFDPKALSRSLQTFDRSP